MSGTPNEPNQPRPWGAPAPEPNPYAPPPMPDALGVPPPPPPPPPPVVPAYGAAPPFPGAPAYGAPPQYPGIAAGYPRPGYGVPPPPPPPPGYGMPDFGIPKPHSSKATASLVCAGVGLVGGFLCMVPALAIPVGLVLGFMGIAETGANGTRSGRGIAITGTAINGLLLVAGIVGVVLFAGAITWGQQKRDEEFIRSTEADLQLIRTRLAEYYEKNNRSLGPGGPRVAGAGNKAHNGNTYAHGESGGTVRGQLTLDDLVGQGELEFYGGNYQLTITGSASATVRVHGYGRGEKSRVMKVFDIGVPGSYTIADE